MVSGLFLFFSVLILCWSHSSAAPANVRPVLVHFLATEGNTALLRCPIGNVDYFTVTWRKQGSDSDLATSSDSRISTVFKDSAHSLQIENIQESDAGTYYCVANFPLTVEYSVKVLPPQLPSSSEPLITHITEDQEINVGDAVELNCTIANAEGLPVIWTKDGKTILSVGQVKISRNPRIALNLDIPTYGLSITNAQESDAGRYECVITRDVLIKKSVELKVNQPPVALINPQN
ncbi:hemicentin-2-like [Phlebotomus argentipes]|uniref:hemicentin-2-like n=1 Tax=Phlebotomus argentipes TaxID=94469 RepID=UPI002892A39F|nr:hemicentin-2-like [Phlebotomus argentipes]